jgi:hypothetical protein
VKLLEMFGLSEHLLTDRQAKQVLLRVDPRVTHRIGHHGKSGAIIFKSANGTVWKLMDSPFEINTAYSLIGKTTKTLIPVLRVEKIGPISIKTLPGPQYYYALQTPEMYQLLQDELNLIWRAIGSYPPLVIDPSADPRAADWLETCVAEAHAHGIDDPDLFGGEENIMKDRQGNWRLIDLG